MYPSICCAIFQLMKIEYYRVVCEQGYVYQQ